MTVRRNKEKIKSQKGFTLIEILVAMALFSVVIGAALGVFSTALEAQRKVLAQQEVLGEMSYAMEYMSRALRMAKKDDINIPGYGTKNCLTGYEVNYETTTTGLGGIRFRNSDSKCQEFFLEGGQLKQEDDSGAVLDLTSSNIDVDAFRIGPSASWSQNDNLQPAVTLFVEITNSDGTKSQFQTTVSQRDIDVQY